MTNKSSSVDAAAAPRDGRYEGGNGSLFVELRRDVAVTGAMSADVYRTQAAGRDYVASVRTAPGTRVDAGDTIWPSIWQDSLGATTTGSLQITATAQDADSMLATFVVDQRINGLPPKANLIVAATRTGDEVRTVGVEMETEETVVLPGSVPFDGSTVDIRECLRRAGFSVHDAGTPTAIPLEPGGWNLSNTFTILHDLMTSTAQASLATAAWDLHLLMLAKSTRAGLLGIMFDTGDVLPRQGAAIFVGEIRDHIAAPDQDRKITQTTVHELGHALNLAHRFERVVGRADSTSFMNYDWRYKGGNQAVEFWQRFGFSFDPDELDFLRHAPRSAVMPGGADFHTVNYWADGTGGYSPYLPEVPLAGFDLMLTPPAAGAVFAFGQPVFLEITLANKTGSEVNLPPEVLDPKAGFLELLIQRRTGAGTRGLVDAISFTPIMTRCFDLDVSGADALPAGGTLRNNLNLTFGSGGFTFAEPGEYDVIPLLSFSPASGEQQDLVIRGPGLRIRVAHPHDMGEEKDAVTLFRGDVGSWFALGGSDCLASAGDALREVSERRTAATSSSDPIVAAITRAAGIDAGRPSTRYSNGRYTRTPGNPDRAFALLQSLDAAALASFDRHTAESTAQLAASYGPSTPPAKRTRKPRT